MPSSYLYRKTRTIEQASADSARAREATRAAEERCKALAWERRFDTEKAQQPINVKGVP